MFLGIDIGTSAVKVCAVSQAGALLAGGAAPLTTQHPFRGASEQDPASWWQALKQALAVLTKQNGIDLELVRAIGLSGQMHSAVLLGANMTPLAPAILWNDSRAQAQCDRLAEKMPDHGMIAGVGAMPGFTAPKIMWLHDHAPQIYSQLRHILLPKDYIGWRLHGGLATDPSDAAGTLWMDQRDRSWSNALCAASQTDPDWLPQIQSGAAVSGVLHKVAAQELGLRPGIAVATGGGDAATGALGVGAVANGDALISLGTSGQLFVTTDSYRPNPSAMVHAYAHTLPDLWFQMAAMLNGARPIAWFAGIANQPIEKLLEAAEHVPSGPLFLPYLTGERTPHGDGDIRAGFWGLGDGMGAPHMMRAVVEAIAYSFADAADALRAAGTQIEAPLAVGGGAQSDFLMQTLADVLGVEIRRGVDAGAGPSMGAARLAMLAVGLPMSDVMTPPKVDRVFQPDLTRADYHIQALTLYRQLYHALKSVG